MPTFTIELSQKAVNRLQAHVQQTNDANGTALTLRDWLSLHLREIAISRELGPAIEQLRQQAERDAQDTLQAAVRSERDRLLQDL